MWRKAPDQLSSHSPLSPPLRKLGPKGKLQIGSVGERPDSPVGFGSLRDKSIINYFFIKFQEYHCKYGAMCGLSLRKMILYDLWSNGILTFTDLLELFQVRNWMLTGTDLHKIINSKVHADHPHHHHSGTKSEIILERRPHCAIPSWCLMLSAQRREHHYYSEDCRLRYSTTLH